MKITICLFLFLTPLLWRGAVGEVKAQNLVPNPSFELDTACPYGVSKLYYAVPWFQPRFYPIGVTLMCSSDLYDTCSSPSTDSIPAFP